MKRLTQRDEYGNDDIIGVDSADLQLNLGFDEFNLVTDAINRLNDDLIRRRAAIDALEWKWAGKAAIDAIKHLPSAQTPQQWHTEPPKESGFYIVCTDLGEVGECVYVDGEWDTDRNYRFPMWCQIVAWMPMPEPYKEESDEL